MKRLRWILMAAMLVAVLAIGPAGSSASTAYAYGNNALWQIGLSFNCNNPQACRDLGGFWGWAEFDNDNTGDAELVSCGHLRGGGQAAGAQHFSDEITGWYIAPGMTGLPDFWITGEEATFTGRHGGPPITVINPNPPYPSDTGVPAVAGHYNTQFFLGFTPPPGVAIQVQVVRLNR